MTADPTDVVAEHHPAEQVEAIARALRDHNGNPDAEYEDFESEAIVALDALRDAGLLVTEQEWSAEDVLRDLAERMTKAHAALVAVRIAVVGRREAQRLGEKANGVALARSYVFDLWRLVSPAGGEEQ